MTSKAHTVVDQLTSAEGRYLCGILYLSLSDATPVSNKELARYLDVSGPSVTGMIESLASDGLLEHEPYYGVELTDRGERIARAIMWRRCAIRRYFTDEIGISLDDDQAYHVASELTTDQIFDIGDIVEKHCQYLCDVEQASDCVSF